MGTHFSGCIYSGAKIKTGGQIRTEKDMTKPEMRDLIAQAPENILIHGNRYAEFYVPATARAVSTAHQSLGEEAMAGIGQSFHLAVADSVR